MPYHIDDKNCVCDQNGPIKGGCHDNHADAVKHLAALEANVPEAGAKESAKPPRTGYFAELAELSEATLSEDGSVARVTLIKPGWSANSRYYSKSTLKAAAPLFEGGQAYADHPGKSEKKDRPERSVRDLVGYYNEVKQEKDGRLTASLHIVQEWLRPIVKASAVENASLAGLSINALGSTRMGEAEGREGMIVESIVKHNSTDIVTTPAAGGKFESLLASDTDTFTRDLLEAMPLDELQNTLREARPDLIKAWEKEWKTPRDTQAVKAARAETASLKTELAEAQQKHRAASDALDKAAKEIAALKRQLVVDRLLATSKLPKDWREDIRGQLMEAKDEKLMLEVLEREARKARKAATPLKVTTAGATVSPQRALPAVASKVALIAESLGTQPIRASTYEEYVRMKLQGV